MLTTCAAATQGGDFDGLLFAHGDPLIGGGRPALEQFVGAG
jgi:hypothetical protein